MLEMSVGRYKKCHTGIHENSSSGTSEAAMYSTLNVSDGRQESDLDDRKQENILLSNVKQNIVYSQA